MSTVGYLISVLPVVMRFNHTIFENWMLFIDFYQNDKFNVRDKTAKNFDWVAFVRRWRLSSLSSSILGKVQPGTLAKRGYQIYTLHFGAGSMEERQG